MWQPYSAHKLQEGDQSARLDVQSEGHLRQSFTSGVPHVVRFRQLTLGWGWGKMVVWVKCWGSQWKSPLTYQQSVWGGQFATSSDCESPCLTQKWMWSENSIFKLHPQSYTPLIQNVGGPDVLFFGRGALGCIVHAIFPVLFHPTSPSSCHPWYV